MVQEGLSATEESGLLHSYHLRYLRQATAAGWRIAFIRRHPRASTTRSLILNMLLIGLSALVGFFFISLLLAAGRSVPWSGRGSSSANLWPTPPTS